MLQDCTKSKSHMRERESHNLIFVAGYCGHGFLRMTVADLVLVSKTFPTDHVFDRSRGTASPVRRSYTENKVIRGDTDTGTVY